MQIITDTIKLIQKMQILDKSKGGLIFFNLWPKQIEFLDLLHSARQIIILKKRQVGASQLVGADTLAQSLLIDGFVTLVLSKTGDDAVEFLRRIRDMYNTLPEIIKKPFKISRDTLDELEFNNGSRIISLPANKGAGYTANRVVVDEAAHITKTEAKIDLETVLRNVTPTLDKAGGQLILISTANGLNLFRNIYYKAKNGLSSFKHFFFSCYDDPTFNADKRKQIIIDMGEDHANQEYPETDNQSFLASGRPKFNVQILQEYEKVSLNPILVGNIDDYDRVIINPKGFITFFSKLEDDAQYLISADVAEGLEKGDFSCAKVFNVKSAIQVAEWHGHIDPTQLGYEIFKLARHYNNAVVAVEANNHGMTTISSLLNIHNYPDYLVHVSNYANERPDDVFKHPDKRFGWYTTSSSKKLIINNLEYLLQNKRIPGLYQKDIDELYTYVIDSKGATNAEQGCFDDRVMTLAIGYYLLDFYQYKQYNERESCRICKHNQKGICYRTGRNVGLLQKADKKRCALWIEDLEYLETPKRIRTIG